MSEKVCYFYSGAIVGSMLKGGVRDVSVFDGSVTVDCETSVDNVLRIIKQMHSPMNTKAVNVRILNKV